MSQLTQKELSYLSDFLQMEQEEVKKFSEAAGQLQNEQARAVLNGIAAMHQGHFETLKRHLNTQTLS